MPLRIHIALIAALVAASGCGGRCPGSSPLEKYTAQLRGECCQFCTEPTDAQLDRSCKDQVPRGRWLSHSEYECPMWAAQCLGEQGPKAAPALIEAARNGPDNFDTGDGIIPVRDAILVSLGKTGNADAVPVLLDALSNKRGSPEAALEGLKWLGPVARPAVPTILPMLAIPGRIREYTADALGAIGDPSAVPALIEALNPDDKVMVRRVTDALAKMGSGASAALPVLKRLVETQPDHEAHFAIRAAIRAIAGSDAANALPKSYEMVTTEISKLFRTVASRRGLPRPAVRIDSGKDEVSARLRSGTGIEIRFDKPAWIARRAVTGTMKVFRDQRASVESPPEPGASNSARRALPHGRASAQESRFTSMAQIENLIEAAMTQ